MKHRNIVLNGTTLIKGGGVQACASFIQEARRANDKEIKWCFLISSEVLKQLNKLGCDAGQYVQVFPTSPARSCSTRRALRSAVDSFRADAVFSFFGPAYVRFRQPHLCGVADGWVTHSSRLAYAQLHTLRAQFETFALCIYKGFWFRRCDAWVVEAACARQGLAKRLYIDPTFVHVIANNCGSQYLNHALNLEEISYTGRVRVLTLSAYYPHKNLELILGIAELLRDRGDNRFCFLLTLSEFDPAAAKFLAVIRERGLDTFIENIGPVNAVDGPELYSSCHICFLPSLLETFSANYPEAMAMRRPIVTSDLDFARDVCGAAALYFDPLDARSALTALVTVTEDFELRKNLIDKGSDIWRNLPSQCERYIHYRDAVLALIDD